SRTGTRTGERYLSEGQRPAFSPGGPGSTRSGRMRWSLIRVLSRWLRPARRLPVRRRPPLLLEVLEERHAPATITWTGAAGDNAFLSAGNWNLNRAPGAGDQVVIDATGISMND